MHIRRASLRWALPVSLATIIIGLIICVAVPNYISSGPSKFGEIINHLRQIEGAKEEWAIEDGFTNAPTMNKVITEKELAPYLLPQYTKGKEFGAPILGEIYLIRKLNQPAEAVLTKNFTEGGRSLPRGTIIRLETTPESDGEEIVLPDGSTTVSIRGITRPVSY